MNYYFDYTYVIFVLPAVLLSLIAQFMVKNRFSSYNRVMCKRGLTGAQAAQLLLRVNNITDVKIAHISGSLTDNYNPSTKVLSLSDSTFASNSIAAIGVAAHETGHAIQHAKDYGPLTLRRLLVPVANIGSRFGPVIAIAGIVLAASAEAADRFSLGQLITDIGLVLFACSVVFYLITLPVEFNASRRALAILKQTCILDSEELKGTKKVLSAAAMTYVASALTAIGSFLRLLFISKNRKR